jgi:hypothetical protein
MPIAGAMRSLNSSSMPGDVDELNQTVAICASIAIDSGVFRKLLAVGL